MAGVSLGFNLKESLAAIDQWVEEMDSDESTSRDGFDDEEEALRVEEEAALASPDELPAVRPYVLSRLLRPGRFAPRHLDGAVAFLGGPPARAPGADCLPHTHPIAAPSR